MKCLQRKKTTLRLEGGHNEGLGKKTGGRCERGLDWAGGGMAVRRGEGAQKIKVESSGEEKEEITWGNGD